MSNTKFIPRFVYQTIVYSVRLDGVEILSTSDFAMAVDSCLAWRGNHPRSNPRRIRLVESR